MSRLSRGEVFRNALIEERLNKSPISSYGVDKKEAKIRDPPAICHWCCRRETEERFKVCQRCMECKIEQTSSIFHYYCSKKCQVLHWKDKHRFEHILFERIGPAVYEKCQNDLCFRQEWYAEFGQRLSTEFCACGMCPHDHHCLDTDSSWTESEED